MTLLRPLRLLIVMLCLVPVAQAQQVPPGQTTQAQARPAVLLADSVFVTRDSVLTAEGNVEVLHNDTRLQARRITYNRATGQLTIDGPIRVTEGGEVLILANAAELDQDLQSGILRGARLVLSQQLQLAAVQLNRVGGRYSQLYRAAATSCRVCDDGRPPLWQIRAERVIHDQEQRQLYFDKAQLRVMNVPVFYVPRLRLPDPTLKRATGFLTPSVRNTTLLGTGVKIPYFIRLGDHRDLTLTPYLSRETTTLEYRYRQAFQRGDILFRGAFSQDELLPDENRWYLFGSGAFDLNRDFKLTFDLQTSSDDAYLVDYGYADPDRLRSELAITRARRDQYIGARLTYFSTLRDDEDNDTIPRLVGDAIYEQRLFPERLGGELRLRLNAHAHARTSDTPVDGPDDDFLVDGRDVARLNASAFWLHSWTVGYGLRAEAQLGVNADLFDISQDAAYPGRVTALTPQAALALRYPLRRTTAHGATHFLEPILQLAWTGGSQAEVPNEESTRVEFDEGNLLALSRFPGPDRREHGSRLAYGVNWARFGPEGHTTRLSFAQILRDDAVEAFTASSGLTGTTSDFLLAGQYRNTKGFAISMRSLFDDAFDFSKAEIRTEWNYNRIRLSGGYVWLDQDSEEGQLSDISSITLDGSFPLNRHWQANADWRYDFVDSRTVSAGLGVTYTNECIQLDLSARRRYTSSDSVEPATSVGFSVAFLGFSAQTGTESVTRSCGKRVQ